MSVANTSLQTLCPRVLLAATVQVMQRPTEQQGLQRSTNLLPVHLASERCLKMLWYHHKEQSHREPHPPVRVAAVHHPLHHQQSRRTHSREQTALQRICCVYCIHSMICILHVDATSLILCITCSFLYMHEITEMLLSCHHRCAVMHVLCVPCHHQCVQAPHRLQDQRSVQAGQDAWHGRCVTALHACNNGLALMGHD
jgi:hypothetical protein